MFPLKEFALKNELLVAAHRGSSGTAPENTISSIEEAIRIGAKFIEIDVQLTKDKHPIVYHDFLPIFLMTLSAASFPVIMHVGRPDG